MRADEARTDGQLMATDKAKILVCEDNVALSGVMCFNLVRAGFEVTSVSNGRLALDALEKGISTWCCRISRCP